MKKGFCIWITGLSGAGKTTLAKAFIDALGRPVTFLDGDEVRQTLCRDLGYSKDERDENVRRIAFVAAEVVKQGGIAVVACISPYRAARQQARETIGNYVEVYLNTPEAVRKERGGYPGEYETGNPEIVFDGNADPVTVISRLTQMGYMGTALMLGRYQPWHSGHTALFQEALKEGGVVIGVRRRPDDALNFTQVKANIDIALRAYRGRYEVMQMPNITNVVYGRCVGYDVTRIELSPEIEAISATKIRAKSA